jgi:hypothetical protein
MSAHYYPQRWMVMSGRFPALAAFTPRKESAVPLNRRLWASEPVWALWKRAESLALSLVAVPTILWLIFCRAVSHQI